MTSPTPNSGLPVKLPLELALLGLLALLWGSSYLFIKIAVAEIPPVTLIAIRVSIAALFLVAVLLWRGERLPRDGKTWRMLFLQAIFNSIGAWTVLAWGQQYVDSGLASVLNSTSPVFVLLITAFVTRHESVGMLRLIGAGLGITGVILIVGPDMLRGLGQQVAGQAAVLLGAVLYAGAAIYGRRFSRLPATVTAAGTMIWASICLVPTSFVLERPWSLAPSINAILATLVLSVFCTGIALLLYFRLVRTLGSMGVASQSYLRAGIGVMLGVFFLGETVTPMMAAGICAALLGVAAINLPVRPKS
ncbi:DMT family transporter [Thalassospira sp.]|uniref:DMT family transporter n=1 Tax=Thalassospira sp. TaxID=1912094 RepID=UPI002733B936|nr:EamA family transporter [Thalassospira sp.]MDP2699205.1 EamA family transporter [Thalassospira sp.]